MSDGAQIVTAAIGIAGTLSAAVLTQWLARRGERERREADDRDRWLDERRRASSELLSGALAIERTLWSIASLLPRGVDRPPDAASSLWGMPEEGVPGLIDAEDREHLMEVLYDVDNRLDALEVIAAQIALIGTANDAGRASDVLERLWDVWGMLEHVADFDDVADAVERCRTARDDFAAAARASLRIDGALVPHDRRPRRDLENAAPE